MNKLHRVCLDQERRLADIIRGVCGYDINHPAMVGRFIVLSRQSALSGEPDTNTKAPRASLNHREIQIYQRAIDEGTEPGFRRC